LRAATAFKVRTPDPRQGLCHRGPPADPRQRV